MRRFLIVSALALSAIGCAPKARLQASALPAAYRGLQFEQGKHPLELQPIEVIETGVAKYDSFFRSSAEVAAQLVMAEAFTGSLLSTMKDSARDAAAQRAAEDGAKEILKGRDFKDLPADDQIAFIEYLNKKGGLDSKARASLSKSRENIAAVVASLGKAALDSANLVVTGKQLTESVKNDFKGKDAMKIPAIAAGLGTSVKNLGTAASALPGVIKNLTRLRSAVSN
jgi:hypothetical protein